MTNYSTTILLLLHNHRHGSSSFLKQATSSVHKSVSISDYGQK